MQHCPSRSQAAALALSGAALGTACFLWMRKKRIRARSIGGQRPPVAPGAWPLVGHLPALFSSGVSYHRRVAEVTAEVSCSRFKAWAPCPVLFSTHTFSCLQWAEQLGAVYTLYFGGTTLHVVADAELAAAILGERSGGRSSFPKSALFYERANDVSDFFCGNPWKNRNYANACSTGMRLVTVSILHAAAALLWPLIAF